MNEMKLFFNARCLLCLLCIIICLSSCAGSPSGTSDTTSDESNETVETSEENNQNPPVVWGLPLEPDRTDLPSYADLSKITKGMTREQVFSLVGNPQRTERIRMPIDSDPSRELTCQIYDSSDGKSVYIYWLSTSLRPSCTYVWKVGDCDYE